ncbi:hypothetical protein CU097_008290 [Rhizopus azygosporus]|uniref:Threonine/serine exporter-like N-terminal domain-containing protein n=1 Tax=Rhizopus azygosporus TaxID=86630 RepID=A0A367JR03_RHIAZ|nr:hypothetical protein CU097_008290 [Rhizopus azygosporus]
MHSLVRNLSASKVTHDGSQLSLASQMTMTDKDVALEEKTRPSLWRSATSLNESKVYIPNLARGDSIATAISMRRADIMVSRDDPQNLHQNETRRDEEEAVDDADKSNQDSVLFEKKKSIIILLGRLLLKCGCPCHRVDDTLQHTSSLLSLNAAFSFLPDSVLITFMNGSDSQSIMVKSPQGYDTGKIATINDIMNSFYKGQVDLDRCLILLHDVATAPPTCGSWATLFFFTASSFSGSALLFNGTWIDASVSGGLGLLVSILYILSAHFPIYARVFEISTSVIVAIIARALYRYCCFTSVVLPAILILLPGYTMTVGVIELSARQVTTGIVRLVYSIFYAFQLAYGLQMGSSVYGAIDPNVSEYGLCDQPPVSPWFALALLPTLSIALSLSYGSSRKQYISQCVAAAIAFCLSFFLGKVIPDGQIVGSIAAFVVGLYSNFALKVTGEPPLAPLCVGLTLLVPGSIGVRGAYSVLHKTDTGHIAFPLQMLSIALGLSAGLFASAMTVYPSGKKRSMYISL